MPEVPHAGEDHGDAVLVGGGKVYVIHADARASDDFKARGGGDEFAHRLDPGGWIDDDHERRRRVAPPVRVEEPEVEEALEHQEHQRDRHDRRAKFDQT